MCLQIAIVGCIAAYLRVGYSGAVTPLPPAALQAREDSGRQWISLGLTGFTRFQQWVVTPAGVFRR
jgi:hypothetical protein